MYSLGIVWDELLRLLWGEKTQISKTLKMLQTYHAELTFPENIFNYSVEEKIHLLFRSYFKGKVFLRRVTQCWKSLLREVTNSLSKEVFKAELETIMADLICCWEWWEVQAKSCSPLFPKTSSSKGNGHPAFFSVEIPLWL